MKIEESYFDFKASPRFRYVEISNVYADKKRVSIKSLLDASTRKSIGKGIGNAAYGNVIVMLVVSDLRIDPRVEKEARVLAAAGYKIIVICPDPTQGQQPALVINWGDNIDFALLDWRAASFVMKQPGYLAYAIFEKALEYKPFAFHAHDANVAHVGLAAANITGAHFVADFHEWFSENVYWEDKALAYRPVGGRRQLLWRALEKRCLMEASEVITVCNSIADSMACEIGDGRRPQVIRNIPVFAVEPAKPRPLLKEQLDIPEDRFVVLYQGGLGPTRYLEPIIRSLAIESRFIFVVRGPGIDQYGPGYRELAESLGVTERLVLTESVPSRDVVEAARGADVGIWTLQALCRNFTYALPNKIFEYIAAGLPILAANYPETSKLVERYEVGATFDPDDPRSIAAAIGALIDDPARAVRFAANAKTALLGLDSAAEWSKLVAIYDSLKSPRALGA